jgi:CheY-like chemotaxis protein
MNKSKKVIVLADDDKWLLDLYGEKLRLEDFIVHTASNGKEAYERILRYKPDIVLSDVVMPGGDGFFLLKKIRKNPLLKDLIVINLTNLSNKQDEEALNDLGSDGYLVKADHTPTQVVDKLRRMLDKIEKADSDE